MKYLMKTVVAVFVATVALLTYHLYPQDIVDISGVYRVSGVNPGIMETYTGAAEIKEDPMHAGVYDIVWVMDDSPWGITAIGKGFIKDGVFIVIIRGQLFELAGYSIQGDVLDGTWVVPGQSGLLKEVLTKTDKKLEDAVQPTEKAKEQMQGSTIRL